MRRRRMALAAATLILTGVAAAGAPLVHSVGSVTRHAQQYVDRQVTLRGYLLAREADYVLFSDEPGGKISRYDLPVVGPGVDQMLPKQRYVLEGLLLDHGLTATNGSPVHLEISTPPVAIP